MCTLPVEVRGSQQRKTSTQRPTANRLASKRQRYGKQETQLRIQLAMHYLSYIPPPSRDSPSVSLSTSAAACACLVWLLGVLGKTARSTSCTTPKKAPTALGAQMNGSATACRVCARTHAHRCTVRTSHQQGGHVHCRETSKRCPYRSTAQKPALYCARTRTRHYRGSGMS